MKYELLPAPVPFSFEGKQYILYKIKALETFGDVSSGETGGLVESTDNLAQLGCCWLYGNAKAFGNARVYDNAKAYDNTIIAGKTKFYGCAKARGNAVMKGTSEVYDLARVYENAVIENAKVRGLFRVYGENQVTGDIWE